MKNSLTPSGIEPATFRFVAQHFNHCATAVSTQYFASDKIKKNEMGVACGAYGGGERHVQGIGGESCGKKPLGRPRRRWEDNIKMDLHEVGCGGYGLDRADSG